MGKEGLLQRLKSLVYDTILMAVKSRPLRKSPPNTLLLVRTDNIGDYVVWRNALPYIRQSERFKNHRITLLGNKAWKGLFDALDAEYVDESLWVEPQRFKKDMRYRYDLLKGVRSHAFETVINTVYSRTKRLDDAFVIAAGAKHNIGQQADDTNVYSYEQGYDSGLYDELFPDTTKFEFEWSRMMRFAEFVTGIDIRSRSVPKIQSPYVLPTELQGRDYFVVFPGSSSVKKSWRGENFAAVAKHVACRYGWLPVIGGSPSDQPYVDEFLRHYDGEYINLTGKTSLLDFAGLASKAKMMVSIDTGSVHVAAFAGARVFVLHNGSHYGRYIPYPAYINPQVYGIFPDETDERLKANPSSHELIGVMDIPYCNITVEKVSAIIDEKLAQR